MEDDLADLEALTAHSLARFGIADAQEAAAMIIADLRRHLAGQTLYISKGFHYRNLRIKEQFNGRNQAALAAQYGLTQRRIEQILRA
jgi:Mor family transcriptional regulator